MKRMTIMVQKTLDFRAMKIDSAIGSYGSVFIFDGEIGSNFLTVSFLLSYFVDGMVRLVAIKVVLT